MTLCSIQWSANPGFLSDTSRSSAYRGQPSHQEFQAWYSGGLLKAVRTHETLPQPRTQHILNSSKCLLLRVSIISNTEVTWHNWDRNISYSIFCSCTDEKTTVCKAGPRTQISLVPVLYFYSNTILSADRSSTYRLEAGDTLILTIILNHSNLQFEI